MIQNQKVIKEHKYDTFRRVSLIGEHINWVEMKQQSDCVLLSIVY